MAEPTIQYAPTRDGLSIAYYVEGESGPPVIHMPPIPWSHLQVEREGAEYRGWFQRWGQTCRLVRYDNRGSGLSDQPAGAVTAEDLLLDIDAVADRLGLERFVLAGISPSGALAIRYAVERPERVSHLLLWCAWPNEEDLPAQLQVLQGIAGSDWALYTETISHAAVAGWGAPEAARHFARVMREGMSEARAEAVLRAVRLDVTGILGDVRAPTLVMQRKETVLPAPDVGRKLAARIPGAQLVMLEGGAILPYVGDVESVHRAAEAFLGVESPASAGAEARAPAQPRVTAALRTIVFTDLEGHTQMMARLGDTRGREVLRAHERLTRQALVEHGGTEVKAMGDGFMASFPSATGALDYAVALQRRMAAVLRATAGAEIRLRIGVNAGEPIEEDRDLFGASVIAASRIAGLAGGGEIVVADVVRQLVAGKGFAFSDRGETALRGMDDPVRLWELRWEE